MDGIEPATPNPRMEKVGNPLARPDAVKRHVGQRVAQVLDVDDVPLREAVAAEDADGGGNGLHDLRVTPLGSRGDHFLQRARRCRRALGPTLLRSAERDSRQQQRDNSEPPRQARDEPARQRRGDGYAPGQMARNHTGNTVCAIQAQPEAQARPAASLRRGISARRACGCRTSPGRGARSAKRRKGQTAGEPAGRAGAERASGLPRTGPTRLRRYATVEAT